MSGTHYQRERKNKRFCKLRIEDEDFKSRGGEQLLSGWKGRGCVGCHERRANRRIGGGHCSNSMLIAVYAIVDWSILWCRGECSNAPTIQLQEYSAEQCKDDLINHSLRCFSLNFYHLHSAVLLPIASQTALLYKLSTLCSAVPSCNKIYSTALLGAALYYFVY